MGQQPKTNTDVEDPIPRHMLILVLENRVTQNSRQWDFITDSTDSESPTIAKGQLISKANCQAANSSKKPTNEFDFTTMRLVFVRFLEEIEEPKRHFEII